MRKQNRTRRIPKILKTKPQRVKEHFYPNYYSFRFEDLKNKIVSSFKGSSVLDIGPGSGWLMREAYLAGFEPIGVDISEKSIAECEFIFKSEKLNLKVIKGSALKLPFDSSRFDNIMMIGVLEHVNPPEKALKEINRVLKRKGIFVVSVPNTYTYGLVYDRLFSPLFANSSFTYDTVLNKLYQKAKIPLERIHERSDDHIVQFTHQGFKKMVEEAGFNILSIESVEVFSSYLSSLLCGILKLPRKIMYPLEVVDIFLSRRLPLVLGAGWTITAEKSEGVR
jgi:ubiquinone/menaquinone biosynthesis C-methylase UbiE